MRGRTARDEQFGQRRQEAGVLGGRPAGDPQAAGPAERRARPHEDVLRPERRDDPWLVGLLPEVKPHEVRLGLGGPQAERGQGFAEVARAVLAARWTVLLSLVAFIGGGLVALGLLAAATLVMGVYPKPFTDVMNASVDQLLRHVAVSKLP